MRTWLLVFALAGCDRVFDLHRPDAMTSDSGTDGELCPRDRDCDEVLDTTDNCPDDVNSGQEDFDQDGLGDACDACGVAPLSSADDEDSDGLVNANDNCFADANSQQENSDGDDVGEACDPGPTAHRLRCGMDFVGTAAVSRAWDIDDAQWHSGGGVITHSSPAAPNRVTLAASGLSPDVAQFAVRMHVVAVDATTRPNELGIGIGDLRCVLISTAMSPFFGEALVLYGPNGDLLAKANLGFSTSARSVTFRMSIERAATHTQVDCSVDVASTSHTLESMTDVLDGVLPVSLIALNTPATFFDVAIYEPAP